LHPNFGGQALKCFVRNGAVDWRAVGQNDHHVPMEGKSLGVNNIGGYAGLQVTQLASLAAVDAVDHGAEIGDDPILPHEQKQVKTALSHPSAPFVVLRKPVFEGKSGSNRLRWPFGRPRPSSSFLESKFCSGLQAFFARTPVFERTQPSVWP